MAAADQFGEQFTSAFGAEIQCQALLPGVETGEDRRFLPPLVLGDRHARDEPGAVRACHGLDVDHLRAEHGQIVGARRSRPESGQVEDTQLAERQRVRRASRVGHRTARWFGSIVSGVLAEARGGSGTAQEFRRGAEGATGLGESVARIGREELPRPMMIHPRDILPVGDRPVRYPESRCQITDIGHGLFGEPAVDLGRLLGGALGDRRRDALVDPFGMSDHGAQIEPLLGRPAAERDHAVGRRGHAGHAEPALCAERTPERLVERDGEVGETQDLGFQYREIHQFADIGARGAHTRGEGGRGRVSAREPFPDATADVHRSPIGRAAPESHDPAGPRLEREIRRGPVPPRAVEPERGDRGDDEVGVLAPDLGGGQARMIGDRCPRRPHHHIRPGQERGEEIEIARHGDVGDHAVLGAAQEGEQRPVVPVGDIRARRRPPSQRIALWRFHFHDHRAAFGEQFRAVGPGDPGREIDDDDTAQRRFGPRCRRIGGMFRRHLTPPVIPA